MAYVVPGFAISTDKWNERIVLGLNDVSTPVSGEVRNIFENGRYVLKVWDGTEWRCPSGIFISGSTKYPLKIIGGSVYTGAGQWVTVTFSEAFGGTPSVATSAGNYISEIKVRSVTSTGFDISGAEAGEKHYVVAGPM